MKVRILSLLIFLGGAVAIFNLSWQTYSLLKRQDLFVQKEKKLAELKNKNQELKETLKGVQSQEFIEKEAREKLNMGKRGEVVVILPNNRTIKQPNNKEEDLPNWKKWYKLFFY